MIWKWVFWLRHCLLCSTKCPGNQGRGLGSWGCLPFCHVSGSQDCCKTASRHTAQKPACIFSRAGSGLRKDLLESIEFIIFPLMEFQYLSISGASNLYSSKGFLLNMVRRADGPGNGVLVPGKGRGEGEGVFQGPHFLTIWSLKLRPCLNACCGLEQWLGRGFNASALVSNYFKGHLCSGVFLNLWMFTPVQRTVLLLPAASS